MGRNGLTSTDDFTLGSVLAYYFNFYKLSVFGCGPKSVKTDYKVFKLTHTFEIEFNILLIFKVNHTFYIKSEERFLLTQLNKDRENVIQITVL